MPTHLPDALRKLFHDTRNALAVISSYAGILEKQEALTSDTQLAHMIGRVSAQSQAALSGLEAIRSACEREMQQISARQGSSSEKSA